MLGVFAELERENIRERSKMGIQKRVGQGCMHGKPTMLGYKWDEGRIEINEETAPVVRWIFKQYLSGVGMLRIAQQLIQGVPGLNVDAVYREFRHVSPHSCGIALVGCSRAPSTPDSSLSTENGIRAGTNRSWISRRGTGPRL